MLFRSALAARDATPWVHHVSTWLVCGLMIGMVGTITAHELTHRTWDPISMFIGRWLLAFSFDTIFSIEHVYGHHRYVSTIDDPATARISHWLEHFRLAAPESGDEWYRPWLEILERSTALGPVDERAIIRDNRPLGYPTLSLLVCAASVGPDGVAVGYAELPAPGAWGDLDLH